MAFDTFLMAMAVLAALGVLVVAIMFMPRLRISDAERRNTVDTHQHEL